MSIYALTAAIKGKVIVRHKIKTEFTVIVHFRIKVTKATKETSSPEFRGRGSSM